MEVRGQLKTIPKQWMAMMEVEGGDANCPHEYDDGVPELNDTEYGGTMVCVHCKAFIHYDVSDIGD